MSANDDLDQTGIAVKRVKERIKTVKHSAAGKVSYDTGAQPEKLREAREVLSQIHQRVTLREGFQR